MLISNDNWVSRPNGTVPCGHYTRNPASKRLGDIQMSSMRNEKLIEFVTTFAKRYIEYFWIVLVMAGLLGLTHLAVVVIRSSSIQHW